MGDDDFMGRNHNPFPSSRYEKWKRAQQRPNREYTSDASIVGDEKIISMTCCAYVMYYLNRFGN